VPLKYADFCTMGRWHSTPIPAVHLANLQPVQLILLAYEALSGKTEVSLKWQAASAAIRL